MKLTKAQTALIFLAGGVVVVGVVTYQFTGVQAQDRLEVKAICANHRALRYATSTTADGGTATRDLLQESASACTAAKRAFLVAKEQHVATDDPTIAELKALRDAATAACDAYGTLGDSVDAVKAACEGADQAYECEYLKSNCPSTDGGT
jgi:hypothetical protein